MIKSYLPTAARSPAWQKGEVMTDHADAFVATIDARVGDILDRCTRCAKCVEVCPTAAPGRDRYHASPPRSSAMCLISCAAAVIRRAAAPGGPMPAPGPADV